ncbi:MAG: glycosyltransferase, partial [Ignavibacteriales bacterium]|nr:glycosyltransferase [Ignavibacteriales bacterium]
MTAASMQKPYFSVIVPLYNQAGYVGEALNTLLNQTFGDWECIIVNDGSTDNSGEVALSYVQKDKRFRYYEKPNGGCGSALNEGLKHVQGEWICWLSSDDFFEPDKLENHVKAIEANPGIKFFYSLLYAYLEDTKQKLPQNLKYQAPNHDYQVLEFFRINYVHGNSFAMHHTVVQEVGNFNIELKQGQDFDMWLRISSKFKTKFMPLRTCTTRLHEAQTTNLFPEGGTFDSTRSLFDFTNAAAFQDIFPFSDITKPEEFEKFFRDIVIVNLDPEFFVNKLGANTLLIDKALDFATRTFSAGQREHIQTAITPFLDTLRFNVRNTNILHLLDKVDVTKDFVFKRHDLLAIARVQARQIAEQGYQKKSIIYERFIYNYTKGNDPHILFYGKADEKLAATLAPSMIFKWGVAAVSQKKNLYFHRFTICCEKCRQHFNFYTEFEYKNSAQSEYFLCPECKSTYFLDESLVNDYVIYHQQKHQHGNPAPAADKKPFAFIIPVADYLGGGTKVVFQYLAWLEQNNINCTVFTKGDPPDWIQCKSTFVKYESLAVIDFSGFDHVISFSVFEILELLSIVPLDKIVHLCQGYQGYHYGTTYDIMRSDKYIFDALHAIPVKLIVVSKHLEELFRTRFGRESLYIPNFIDHSVFYPRNGINRIPNSILFIGTPDHLLKNFIFLVMAVKHIMSQHPEIKPEIHLVTGHVLQNDEATGNDLSAETGVEIKCYHHIHPQEVAHLMHSVSVVCCTSWYEGFGLPMLEAMACGTPVITTNTMGTDVFCNDMVNSRVLHCQNGLGFAEALLAAFNEGNVLRQQQAKGIETAAHYNYNKSAEAFCKAIYELRGRVITIPFSHEAITPATDNKFLPVDIMIPVNGTNHPDNTYIAAFEESTPSTLRISFIYNADETSMGEIHSLHGKNLIHFLGVYNNPTLSELHDRALRAFRHRYVLLTFP